MLMSKALVESYGVSNRMGHVAASNLEALGENTGSPSQVFCKNT